MAKNNEIKLTRKDCRHFNQLKLCTRCYLHGKCCTCEFVDKCERSLKCNFLGLLKDAHIIFKEDFQYPHDPIITYCPFKRFGRPTFYDYGSVLWSYLNISTKKHVLQTYSTIKKGRRWKEI